MKDAVGPHLSCQESKSEQEETTGANQQLESRDKDFKAAAIKVLQQPIPNSCEKSAIIENLRGCRKEPNGNHGNEKHTEIKSLEGLTNSIDIKDRISETDDIVQEFTNLNPKRK